jgi:tetratricopeptide (TPR) repeat protein
MKLNKYILLVILAALSCGYILAASGENVTATADSLYLKGNYKEAIAAYNEIPKNERSASVFFNMGNAYVKDGNYAMAMLNYKMASKLDPSNDAINNNIKYLSDKIQDKNKAYLKGKLISVAPDDESFFEGVRSAISHHSAFMWGVLAVIFFILMLVGVGLYILSGQVTVRKIGFFGSIVSLVLVVVFNVIAFIARAEQLSEKECVITEYEGQIYPEPNDNSTPQVTPLTGGTVLKVIETEDKSNTEWLKVKLNSKYIGWIPSSAVTLIKVDGKKAE